jgi:hypothetical protein
VADVLRDQGAQVVGSPRASLTRPARSWLGEAGVRARGWQAEGSVPAPPSASCRRVSGNGGGRPGNMVASGRPLPCRRWKGSSCPTASTVRSLGPRNHGTRHHRQASLGELRSTRCSPPWTAPSKGGSPVSGPVANSNLQVIACATPDG